MPKSARLGDSCAGHGCMPATSITSGSSDVSINGMPAARQGDSVLLHVCPCPKMPHGIHDRSISAGSSNVSINGKSAARVGDTVGCGGFVTAGSSNVFIGDTPYKSPSHQCGENAVNNHAPLLAITPMPILKAIKWAKPTSQFITADLIVTTVKQRKVRYKKRKELANFTANENNPNIKAASERLAFNNDSILRAEAAEYVYRVDENRRKLKPLPEPLPDAPLGLEILDNKKIPGAVLMDTESGFGAVLFKSEINDVTMLTYRGTNNDVTGKKDWSTNIAQGFGMRTKQYDQAMDLALLAKRALGKEFEIIGHSLGGGLAASAVGVTGIKGYTFNSAGLHKNTVQREGGLKIEQINGLVQTQAVDGEVLTWIQNRRKLILPGIFSGLGGMLAGNVGAGIGTVMSTGLLSKGDIPEAPGNMQTLKSIEGGNPVTRHGMDQVIAGIETQKEEDISTLSQYQYYRGNNDL